MPKQGEFVWHDLATSDLDAATAFYTEVIGWKAEPMENVPMEYIAYSVGDDTVGAAMAISSEMAEMGARPSWTPVIATEDIDTLCKKVAELGGNVMQPPQDVPGGRFALLADPQGAIFESYQSAGNNGEAEQSADPPAGHFSWYDLNTTDWEAGRAFYSELFGWSESSVMESPGGTYWMFKNDSGDRSLGGMSNMAAKFDVPPHWLCYITVADLDATIDRLKKHGGKVVNGPMAVPGGDRIVHCVDAQGAPIALHAAKS